MEKRITDRSFFTKPAEELAQDLIGKFIYCEDNKQKYQIIETEAYYHNEKDYNKKYFCYGVKKDNKDNYENSITNATMPLFRNPGTWCIYGGQLLLSATNMNLPDNVLIKKIKTDYGELLSTDKIAKELLLYQKELNSNYWKIHCLDSLLEGANLYLLEGSAIPYISQKRINIKNDSKFRYTANKE